MQEIKDLVEMFAESGIKITEEELYSDLTNYISMAKRQGLTGNDILKPKNIVRYFELRVKFWNDLLNNEVKKAEFAKEVFKMLKSEVA